ncbi:MAG: 5-bromo-4-chloroindolyl phosphate hydrolysis family protein [Firmicutes bacterium]|nr:5-bromo-4-chloroindolyl phosphate hydrolysis family protein [Bacillota bacterium]
MKKNKAKEFGRTRIVVIVLLGLLGLIYLPDHTFLGLLLIIIALFTIIVDKTTNSQNHAKAKEAVAEPKYNAEDFGPPMECPFCGKEIPSEINYCFYCGRALQGYKKIEAVRKDSLSRMNNSLDGIGEGAHRDNILKIRDLADKILRNYEKEPEDHESYDKFIENYLPKTVSAIEHYHTLCNLNNLDHEEERIKAQFENSLAMLADAFSNILNRVSTEGLLDISTDITVLENILKQEGLADSDFPS